MRRLISFFIVFIIGSGLVGCGEFSGFSRPAVTENPQLARATFSQAMAVTQGVGQEQNYQRGVELFKESARYGSTDGAYMAGMSYLAGRGVEQNNSEAAYWLDLAAAKDHPEALYQLSVLYLNGSGVKSNAQWYAFLVNRAADLGHPQAAFDTAVGYVKGFGVSVSPASAWYWFSVARVKGLPKADRLQARMLLLTNQRQRDQAVRQMRYKGGKLDRSTSQFIQQRLTDLGYQPGGVDGIWGAKSAQAFQRFTQQELLLSDMKLNWNNLKLIRDY